ncbi:MAG: DEAD/DEAH box helicase [Solirubrobacterales bacterium]
MSDQSFADLGVSTPVRNALSKRGITHPFAVQTLVIGDALAGRDVLVRSPTGSGKTLAFAAPLVDRLDPKSAPGSALVIAPTRELALQICEDLRPLAGAKNLSVATVYGGAGIHKQAKLARRAQIIVATPGRLLDLMGRGDVSLKKVRILVLDEADRMLDMGFRPDVDRIIATTPTDRQTMLFSATLDGEVARIAKSYTRSPVRHEHVAPKSKVQVEHRFVGVTHEKRFDALLVELRADRELALVFVRTKRGADKLVKKLASNGIKAVAMHGNKSQGQRERALAAFDSGKVDALVATDVAARGIDVDGISHVINFDPPGDCDAYQHRIGRTARAGRGGVGVTLVRSDEAHDVGKIADTLQLRRQFAETGYAVSAAPRPGTSAPRRRRRR